MDITINYKQLKAVGNAEIIKAGGGFAFAMKRWDATTGQQIAPEIFAIDTESLTKAKETLLGQIADIDELLNDMNNLA